MSRCAALARTFLIVSRRLPPSHVQEPAAKRRVGATSSLMKIGYSLGILAGRCRRTGDLVAEDGKGGSEVESVSDGGEPAYAAG